MQFEPCWPCRKTRLSIHERSRHSKVTSFLLGSMKDCHVVSIGGVPTMFKMFAAGVMTVMLVSTASAQMCGGSLQEGGAMAQSSGMSCGMKQTQVDDPFADKPASKPSGGMMCACCKNMAMMRSMKPGDGEMQHDAPSVPAQPMR